MRFVDIRLIKVRIFLNISTFYTRFFLKLCARPKSSSKSILKSPRKILPRIIDDPPVVSQLFIASLRAGYFDTLSLVIRL